MKTYDDILNDLSTSIGLDAESLGKGMVRRLLEKRTASRECSEADYVSIYFASSAERTALAEELVVPETWFFRDRTPFDFLKRWARERAAASDAPLRILSLPCSTGEEPYSIAMTLFEAGLEAGNFRVDALDLSKHAIAAAEEAVYGPHSFRGVTMPPPSRWFEAAAQGCYRVTDAVRNVVFFRQGNILHSEDIPRPQPYDVIFCRNLLIYLTSEHRKAVSKLLLDRLAANGLLFVGHAESLSGNDLPAQRLNEASVFAYQRIEAPRAPQANLTSSNVRAKQRGSSPLPQPSSAESQASTHWTDLLIKTRKIEAPPHVAVHSSDSTSAAEDTPTTPSEVLQQAQRLADQGAYDAAHDLVHSLLAQHPSLAQAEYLRAVIEEARGHKQVAETAFRRALYLSPRHSASLIGLALLLEERGASTEASRLRERAARLDTSVSPLDIAG